MASTAATLCLTLLLLGGLVGCGAPERAGPSGDRANRVASDRTIVLATTTSTDDSGLLTFLLPFFETEWGARVAVIAVGTGQALQIGRDGDADVLVVHARDLEDLFMDEGHGVRREDLMVNDFIIVGPGQDPAGIRGIGQAGAAFARIASAEATFISRGDDSGTHAKERAIWSTAQVDPAGAWYVSAGQGMGDVLTMAEEEGAYTLTDRATYLTRTRQGTELVILMEGDPGLVNTYGVIAVNPTKSPQIKAELADRLIDWLISVPAQEKIGQFGLEEFGTPLFNPASEPWHNAN